MDVDRDLRPETIEREAARDLFAAAPRELVEGFGIVTAELAGATCTAVAALPDVSVLDRVVGLGLGRSPRLDEIVAIGAFFDESNASATVHVAPVAAGRGVPALLRAAGFENGYAWMKFARVPEPAKTAGGPALEVVEAGPRDAAVCGSLVAESFGMPSWTADWIAATVGRPGWTWFLARAGGEPAGVGASFTRDGVCWLGLGGVRGAHRGKGIQRLLLGARVAAAWAEGCDLVVTETGGLEPGKPAFSYRNILAAGFEERYLRPNLVRRRA